MSPDGTAIARRMAGELEALREHEETFPHEVAAIVAHLDPRGDQR